MRKGYFPTYSVTPINTFITLSDNPIQELYYVEALDISDSDETSRCVSYDAREKEIKLTCKVAHLSDIYNQVTIELF